MERKGHRGARPVSEACLDLPAQSTGQPHGGRREPCSTSTPQDRLIGNTVYENTRWLKNVSEEKGSHHHVRELMEAEPLCVFLMSQNAPVCLSVGLRSQFPR